MDAAVAEEALTGLCWSADRCSHYMHNVPECNDGSLTRTLAQQAANKLDSPSPGVSTTGVLVTSLADVS